MSGEVRDEHRPLTDIEEVKRQLKLTNKLLTDCLNDLAAFVQTVTQEMTQFRARVDQVTGTIDYTFAVQKTTPTRLIHNLDTKSPFVSVFTMDGQQALYKIRVIDNNTIELDSPEGYMDCLVSIKK